MHLKLQSDYEDRYDHLVVDQCRRSVKIHEDIVNEINEPNTKDQLMHRNAAMAAHHLMMYFLKGELWQKRRETIENWMAEDKRKDEIFNDASAPSNVLCMTCSKRMDYDVKTLDYRRGKDHVLFFFHCSSKHRGRAIYEDGEEWQRRDVLCEKCSGIMKEEKVSRKKEIIQTTYKCTKCNHVDISELDMRSPEPQTDLQYEEDKKLYCLSEEEGQSFSKELSNWTALAKIFKEEKEKEDNRAFYQLIDSLERLTIPQLEKMVLEALNDSQFVRLALEKPEIGRDVVVPFIIYDESERDARASSMALQKILKKALAKTNWAPFSEAPSYRMGMLSGSMRGVESEDAIKKLVEKRLKAKELKLPKVVEEKKDDEPGIVYTQDGTRVTL